MGIHKPTPTEEFDGLRKKQIIEKTATEITRSTSNFQVVLDEDMTVKELVEALHAKAKNGVEAYKPLSLLDKIRGKEVEPKGKPVMIISHGDQGRMMEELITQFLAIDSKGRPKLSDDLASKATELITKYRELGFREADETRTTIAGDLMKILDAMVKQKGFDSLTIVIDTTNNDRAQAMALGVIEEMKREEKPDPEIENYRKVVLLPLVRESAKVGTFAKTLHAITGASIVLPTLKEKSFDATSGNLGMQKGHDYLLLNLNHDKLSK